MANPAARSWIEKFQLTQHIEGGWYSEVYRSPLLLESSQLPSAFTGPRHFCTHIYFLLEKGNFSAFHRIKSDELWHFYAGDPLIIYEIDEKGIMHKHILGNEPGQEHSFFTMIRAGNWFASVPAPGSEYALVGCTVSPGFDFKDFEMAKAEDLLTAWPEHALLIRSLCR